MTIAWKSSYATITMPITQSGSPMVREISSAMDDVQQEMRECRSQHAIIITYRRYRRGRNRCQWCGCKLEGHHE